MGYPTETDSLHRQARAATVLGQPAISSLNHKSNPDKCEK